MIRKATNNDIGQIAALLYELNQFHQDNLPNDYKPSEAIAEKIDINCYINDDEKVALVACSDAEQQKIVGFILGDMWERKSLILKSRKIANIADILVDKEFQSKGIGKQLYQTFEREMKALGAEEIWVEIYDFNKTAIAFYRSCGIEPYIHLNRKLL